MGILLACTGTIGRREEGRRRGGGGGEEEEEGKKDHKREEKMIDELCRWRLRADGLAANQWVSVGVARAKTSRTNYVDAHHW